MTKNTLLLNIAFEMIHQFDLERLDVCQIVEHSEQIEKHYPLLPNEDEDDAMDQRIETIQEDILVLLKKIVSLDII